MLPVDGLLIKALIPLGVASLAGYIGEERANRMESLGLDLSLKSLSEMLVYEHGLSLFKSKEIRLDVLSTFSSEEIRTAFLLKTNAKIKLTTLNNFKWGTNEKTNIFLSLLGVDPSELSSDFPTRVEDNSEISVEMCLYPYQNWVRKGVLSFIHESDNKKLLIHMPTGAGKTRTVIEAIIDYLRHQTTTSKLIVWMAHSDELCEQAAESFENIWEKLGSETANVHRLWGGRKLSPLDKTRPTFLVTSFQTAYRMTLSSKDTVFRTFTTIRGQCALLIVDEAHLSTARTYKQAIESFSNNNTKVIGLTATPGRHHHGGKVDQTEELSKFYEDNLLRIKSDEGEDLENPIEYLTDKKVLARVERYRISTETQVTLSEKEAKAISNMLDIPSSVLKKLGENEQRTNLIVTQVIRLANTYDLKTIVFAPSRQNAIEMCQILRMKNCDARAITGETNKSDRRRWIQQFKDGNVKVLVNFGVLTTGFDAPNIEAVVVARPTTSVVLYSQMIGRGLRGPAMGGKPLCHLVDVIDNIINMPDIGQAFNYFNEFYSKKGTL